jgi:hypothetical protein
MGSKGGGQVAGYKYYLGVFMGVCMGPIDALVAIKVGDVSAWTGNVTTSQSFAIHQPNLFGGDQKEGGIDGTLQAFMGGTTQVLPADVKDSLNGAGVTSVPNDAAGFPELDAFGNPIIETVVPAGGPVPGYRGVFTMFYRGLISANNPYPKPWKMRVRRITKGWDGDTWYPETATIAMSSGQAGPGVNDISAMNGAHIIYECATNGIWGRGLDRSQIDDYGFRVAALQLYNEGFGLCLRWSRQETLTVFVQQVADHIGAAVYLDRLTGLLTITLMRGGYDPTTLPKFDANSGLLSILEDDSGSQDTSPNEVIVQYTDPVRDQARQTRAQSLAAVQSIGSIISTTTSYPGIPTPELASRVALRDLTVSVSALKRYTVKLDRRGWGLSMAGLLVVSDEARGVENLILRIGKIEDSTSGDGSITITALQDVFGLPDLGFVAEPEILWEPPDNVPGIPSRRNFSEVTYRDLVRSLTPANLAAVDDTSGAVVMLASRANQTSTGYELETKTGSEAYAVRATGAWTPSARQPRLLSATQTVCTLDLGSEWSRVVVGSAVRIEDEWVRLDAFNATTGVVTIARGCVDTVPVAHNQCYWFFADAGGTTDAREYSSSEVVSAKVLTLTSSDVLSETLAPVDTVTIVRRHFRPYPPGNVAVNGIGFAVLPAIGDYPGDRTVTWSHRDRLTQLDTLVSHGSGNIGPEAGTTYTVRVYAMDNTLLRTVTGLTGTTWTYTVAMQSTDVARRKVRMELESVRGGLASYQKYSVVVPLMIAGWGFAWDTSWGMRP